ncbi:hypothetical protein GJW-30_1_04108 [Variibacter gotjawalensis]|uniref:FHA domain-containing protein n=1 Tax=Variibacter gotjawalensis TaxID=1333996 RepID=A0A0S3Q057_9BRAD|nr:trypsin-like peptidase domain-containing protein [Variibacter gotjawalensis]NIK47389.1 hypothetical protein [Variibacter gotjawalensis]RZS49285.1 trypsin-like peptidase [Variibacter gotjawalensis]BAT61549.1 hypothetical protein GJW-30_1_04108 [Variibacter gotjawalensis]
MPTIRHRTGPLAGKEQNIDPRVERITFGRDPAACDVVFPPDLTVVARRHFAFIRKPSGEWMFEDFGDPYVAINGDAAESDEAVHSGALVELGKKGGPSFEVIFEGKEIDAALPMTAVQQKVTSSREAARRARTYAMGGTAAAVAIALCVGAYAFFSRSDASKLEGAVAELERKQAAAAADSIPGPVRDKVMAAAHVVVVQFADGRVSAQGTASPIGEDLLVTNAHVAELREQLGPKDKLIVRSPGEKGKVYEVIEHKLHPGYRAYSSWKDADPIFVTAAKSCATCLPNVLAGSPSYDVALLRVARGSNLSPILEVATTEELMAMRPGQAIGLAGYPLERIIGSEVQGLSATPSIRTGMITAMTDMFNLPGDVKHRRLVQHNIPVTGGNSGSPMVAPNGKLVALLNAGNIVKAADGGRIPNAAIVNYGQRADLVRELLDGTAEANLKSELAYWTQQTASMQRGFEVIVPILVSQSRPSNVSETTKPQLVSESKGALTKSEAFSAKDREGKDSMRRQRIQPIQLKANVPTTIVAYANQQTPLQLYLVVDGQIAQQDERGTWFPAITVRSDKDQSAEVYIVGADKDTEYRLQQYSWAAPGS